MIPEISVIVPVYNAEQYVSKCIESLLCQTFGNFEILLINDGSTDTSAEICRRYVCQDSRVKLFEQENQGVCSARNKGLDVASGELITFVDSDDWMESNGLEILFNQYKATNADLIVADMAFVEGKNKRNIRIFDKAFTTEDKNWIDKYEMACIGYGYNPNPGTRMNIVGLGSMGNKLYKTGIIEKYKLRFDPYTLGIYEDNLFVLNYLEKIQKVTYISKVVYNYRKVANSNSRGFKPKTLEINKRIFEKITEFIKQYKKENADDYYKALYIYIIRRLAGSLNVYFFSKDNPRGFIDRLNELQSVICSEPYYTAIQKVDWRLLNPKNHRITWLTARTYSAIVIWFFHVLRTELRAILIKFMS